MYINLRSRLSVLFTVLIVLGTGLFRIPSYYYAHGLKFQFFYILIYMAACFQWFHSIRRHFLQREAESQENEDPMASLRQAAEAVDIRLVFDGEIPGDSEARKIIGMAVHECLTNAVKHARAHTLTVRIRRTGNTQTVTLTNDGLAPTEPIREKGGLSSLRAYLEQHGAMMELESKPAFRLLITIDQEEVPHG